MTEKYEYQRVLEILKNANCGLVQQEIVAHGIHKPTVNKILVKMHWVRWVSNDQKRGWFITELGKQALSESWVLGAVLRGEPPRKRITFEERIEIRRSRWREKEVLKAQNRGARLAKQGEKEVVKKTILQVLITEIDKAPISINDLAERMGVPPDWLHPNLNKLARVLIRSVVGNDVILTLTPLGKKAVKQNWRIGKLLTIAADQFDAEQASKRMAFRKSEGEEIVRMYREISANEIRLPKPKAQVISGWVVL